MSAEATRGTCRRFIRSLPYRLGDAIGALLPDGRMVEFDGKILPVWMHPSAPDGWIEDGDITITAYDARTAGALAKAGRYDS